MMELTNFDFVYLRVLSLCGIGLSYLILLFFVGYSRYEHKKKLEVNDEYLPYKKFKLFSEILSFLLEGFVLLFVVLLDVFFIKGETFVLFEFGIIPLLMLYIYIHLFCLSTFGSLVGDYKLSDKCFKARKERLKLLKEEKGVIKNVNK